MKELFSSVDAITEQVANQMRKVKQYTGLYPKAVIITGGFGKNQYLIERLEHTVKGMSSRTNFRRYRNNAGWTAVSVGAALFAKDLFRGCEPINRQTIHEDYYILRKEGGEEFLARRGDQIKTVLVSPKHFFHFWDRLKRRFQVQVYTTDHEGTDKAAFMITWEVDNVAENFDGEFLQEEEFCVTLKYEASRLTYSITIRDVTCYGP